jgi:hypothetical protein
MSEVCGKVCGKGECITYGCERPKGHEGEHRAFSRLDGVDCSTLYCPCGASFTWEGIDDGLNPWLVTHRPHLEREEKESNESPVETQAPPRGTFLFEPGCRCGLCYQPIADPNQMTVLIMERYTNGGIPVIAAHKSCAEGMR